MRGWKLGRRKAATDVVVFFGRDRFVISGPITGSELRRLFEVPADELLMTVDAASRKAEEVKDAQVVEPCKGMLFTAVPRVIDGGRPHWNSRLQWWMR